MNYAVIDATNLVINVVLWDGKATWQPPEGCIAVKIPADSSVSIGWTYADGQFTPPPED